MYEIKRENASELKDLLYKAIITAPNVTDVEWVDKDKHGFSRTLRFSVNGKAYKIRWAWNESSLYFDENSFFRFNSVEQSGTWPNEFKTNLQFYLDGEPIGVIPLEEWGE